MNNKGLTEQEVLFCELYVNGTTPYVGNAAKCYSEVFEDTSIRSRHRAKMLLAREDIKDYIQELGAIGEEEAVVMKRYLTQNLMSIINETATAEYRDRRGTLLSPAPLRSVAVNAAKALMEMYPVKEAVNASLSIEGNGNSGIVFNVIVPEPKDKSEVQENG